MKTIHLTRENTSNAVAHVVGELGGDFVYTQINREGNMTCRYVHQGKASCLIGRVLHKLGVPLEAFLEDRCASELLDDLAETGLSHGFVLTWEPGVPGYLDAVQKVQDDMGPYRWARVAGEAFWEGWDARQEE